MSFLKKNWIWCLLALLALTQSLRLWKPLLDDQPLDFRQLYVSARLWNQQVSPYDDSLLKKEWIQLTKKDSVQSNSLPGAPYNRSVYPPHAIALFRLVSDAPWLMLRWFWWALLLLMLGAAFFLLPGLKWWQAGLIFFSFKASFPALQLGQPVLWAFFFFTLFLWSMQKGKSRLALLALTGMSIKISLLLPVMLWFIMTRQWGLFRNQSMAGVFILLFLWMAQVKDFSHVMLSWMEQMQLQWQSAYDENPLNPLSVNLTEAGIWATRILGLSWAHPMMNYILFGCGCVGLYVMWQRKMLHSSQLLFLLFLLNFLCGYHLIYDLMLLLPAFLFTGIRLPLLAWPAVFVFVLPLNAVFSQEWIQAHLAPTLIFLFVLFSVYFVRQNKEDHEIRPHTMH